MATNVLCPTCGAKVPWSSDSPYRPFCSKRCKLIDFGGWLDGRNSIPGNELDEADLDRIAADDKPANDFTR